MPRSPYLCLLIASLLGAVALAGVVFLGVASLDGRPLDPTLAAIIAGCVGSLSSLLTSAPREDTGPRPAVPDQQPLK